MTAQQTLPPALAPACRDCRRPVRAAERPPGLRGRPPTLWVHIEPTDCTNVQRAAVPNGYTTQGLAVFSTVPPPDEPDEPDDRQQRHDDEEDEGGYPGLTVEDRYWDVSSGGRMRRYPGQPGQEADTTNTDWWAE